MNLFRRIPVSDDLLIALHEREMSTEHSINRFRAAFLIIIAFLDIVSSLFLKGINYSSKYEILGSIVAISGIFSIVFIYYSTKKGKKYNRFIKYISVTLDLLITFVFACGVMFWMEFPIPIAKETFAVLVTIIFMFFNILSVLRTDKNIVIYSGVLTLLLNIIMFLGFYFVLGKNINMLIGYTSFFIVLLSIFNLWVSEQILKSFIANKGLENANVEISEKNIKIEQKNEELNQLVEEISSQRDEIEAQRNTVTEQKNHIENIHNEVENSINYATRLQQSILPEEQLLKKYLTEHFVLFKPKDKVSGDFYWWTHIEGHTIITAADCTGHGVPGAFMSMLGVSFLREIVEKEYITNTGLILKKLRKEIIKALKQKGATGEQKDGMDMAIISINHKTNIVQFSGANNPLYLILNSELRILNEKNSTYVKLCDNSKFMIQNLKLLYEVKPNKMPIAIYDKMDNFTTHEIQLQKGDHTFRKCRKTYD